MVVAWSGRRLRAAADLAVPVHLVGVLINVAGWSGSPASEGEKDISSSSKSGNGAPLGRGVMCGVCWSVLVGYMPELLY